MKRSNYLSYACALLALVLTLGTADAIAQKPAIKRKAAVRKKVVPKTPVYTVSTGTIMRVRMNQTLNSKTARVGETFTTNVTEPVYSTNGVVVVPVGSVVTGRVDMVKPAAKGGKVGQIDVSFTRLRLPNGRVRAINGSLTSVDMDGANIDNEGSASGEKMGHRKLIFYGGGTAGGAIIGGAIGGGKGALIGGLLGAGGAYLGDKYLKGKEAKVESGTELGIHLNQSITMPRFTEVSQ
jgi:hypothetical protein